VRARERFIAIAGLAAVATSVLAIGGALRWSQALVAGLVAIALTGNVPSRRVLARPSPLVLLLGIAIGLTVLQLLPLPDAVLGFLNSTGVRLRADGAALLNVSPWNAVSLDAPGTMRALVFSVTVLGVAVIALRLAATERGRYYVLSGVAATCGLTSIVVWLHHLLGAKHVYGLYEPAFANPHLLGPLLNLNHLACLMAVGAVLGIGLALYRRQPNWLRIAWIAMVGSCGALCVATVSRGGTLALGAGVLIVAGMLVGQRFASGEGARRRRGQLLTTSLPIGVVAACAIALVVYSSAGNVQRQLEELSLSEVEQSRTNFAAWRASLALVGEAPWLGVGRGAFEPSFTRVYPDAGFSTFSHLENEYLQAIVDWGVPGALALAVVLGWLAVVALRRWRDGPLTAGALAALGVVAVQSNVDFGIALLGIAAPIAAVAATVTYVPLREAPPPTLRAARTLRVVHVVALVGGAALILSPVTRTIAEDHALLGQASTLAEVREVTQRHPLDYRSYEVAARLVSRDHDRSAIYLFNHALRLHPTHPGLHRRAARLLYAEGYAIQAAIEYAEALRSTRNPSEIIAELVGRFPPEQAAQAIPIDFPHPKRVVQMLVDLDQSDVATAWLVRLREHEPGNVYACELLYAMAQRTKLVTTFDRAARACGAVLPDLQTRLDLAAMLIGHQAYPQVIRLLGDVDRWSGRIDAKLTGWLALCDAHLGLGSWDEAKLCLRRLEASVAMTAEATQQIRKRMAQIEQARRAPEAPEPQGKNTSVSPTR
jgi:O-antigen ligase